MLSFKLQRQTVVALVGLTFLCILPSVAALDVRTTAFPPSSTVEIYLLRLKLGL